LELGFGSCSYDYAIYDPVEEALKVVAEVKRLRSLVNVKDYIEAFVNETEKCLAAEPVRRIVLHLHSTPEILERYQGLEGLLLGLGKVVQLSECRPTLIAGAQRPDAAPHPDCIQRTA